MNLANIDGLLLAGCATSVSTGSAKPTSMPEVTIYHLEGRRSERIVWLMETQLELAQSRVGELAIASEQAALNMDVESPGAPLVRSGRITETHLCA